MLAFGMLLVPVLYMVFGLPQLLPGEVLKWIGAGISDLGETQAIGAIQSRMQGAGTMVQNASKVVAGERAKVLKERAANQVEAAPSGVRQRLPGHGGQGVTPKGPDRG